MSEPLTATEPQVAPGTLSIPVPKTIGRFTILNEIGRGSYGIVWAAHDPVLGREVAIKIIPLAREAQFRTQIEANFLREAKSAGAMSHPSIVTIYDAGKTDTLAYIAMERLHGQDLHEYLAGGNRMSPRQAASMMMRLADAIHYANKRGLVHRDIKPSNIFLSRDLKPKLLDFGTALAPVAVEDKDNSTRHLVGTPNYMSPEQAKGEPLDARSDIFSLGTILYELLTGRRAFDGRTIDETLEQVVSAHPRAVDKLRPETPPALVAVVRKAMERDPGQRYQKAADFRNALADFVDGSRAPVSDITVAARLPSTSEDRDRSVPLKMLLGSLSVVAAVLLLYLALRPQPQHAPPPVIQAAPQPVLPAPPPPVAEAPAEGSSASVEEAKPAEARTSFRRRNENVVAAVPVRDGSVTLAVAPWGEVYVDGAARGVSPPLTQLSLPPGAHTIEIRNNTSPPFSVRVELKSGESIALQHRF
ncbi:MAG TPA: serine/threonine-protein kinase [Burkholderiaceae bacterium]|nr:serine/threonine-protein kinase [Burkholderiaceae bacterium]